MTYAVKTSNHFDRGSNLYFGFMALTFRDPFLFGERFYLAKLTEKALKNENPKPKPTTVEPKLKVTQKLNQTCRCHSNQVIKN